MIKKIFIAQVALILMTSTLMGSENSKQQEMLSLWSSIHGTFKTLYAPAKWKFTNHQWSLEEENNRMISFIQNNPRMKVKTFQKQLKKFFSSTKDYHVSFEFLSTEKSSLPLEIKGDGERYFLEWIDRKKLSEESFPFEVGDEVINFDGRPILDEINYLKKQMGSNISETDESLAQLYLTWRSGASAMKVPKGPVSLHIKRKDEDEIKEHQLIWTHKPELIDYNLSKQSKRKSLISKYKERFQMSSPLSKRLVKRDKSTENPFDLGGRTSFLPTLGTKIWESDEDTHYDAYIYLNEEKKLVGYVRIPTYDAGAEEVEQFQKIIDKMEATTDLLIIDQLQNPGGSVFYMYSLLSMLTDTALVTAREHMTITQEDVKEAATELPKLENLKTQKEITKFFEGEKTIDGWPLDLSFVSFLKGYYQFILEEWKAKRYLTNPWYVWGVDKINPHPETQYTKPILLLVNEMDFSGGDFFPAILQDNKRVTILGTRTAGAGGYVLEMSLPNRLGLSSWSLTGSLAKRVNDRPIENLGVTPDVEYKLTSKDFQNSYSEFISKIKETLKQL